MAIIKGTLKTGSGDSMYPETSADSVVGLTNIVELEDNGSTTAGTWLAKTDLISSLEDGCLFLWKVPVAGASTTTLDITANGTSLGAKTVYRVGTTKLTTQYPVGHYLLLTYNSLNTCFRVVNDSDANSYAYVRQYQYGSNAAGSGTKYPLLARYNLTNKNGTYDTAYTKYHTDTTVDTSNGYLYAPKVFSGGEEVATKDGIGAGVLTIKVNGTTKATFGANQSAGAEVDVTASDLGLSGAMSFLGTTTTAVSDGSTSNPVSIGGSSVTAVAGDVVLYGNKEFLWDGSKWAELGDAGSYALKTVKVTGTGALGGGGTLESNRTITHGAGNAASKSSGFYKFSTDAYSHVGSVTAVTKADITGLGIPGSDTWRPLGTGADEACAGNDPRLSDSRPASDVSAWAKASTKPSYSWSEITDKPTLPDMSEVLTTSNYSSYALPLSGGTMTGTINTTENTYAFDFRPNHDSYHTRVAYETAGNEALVFTTKNEVTSFIFANGVSSEVSSDQWAGLTPGLQVKNNCVAIGKLIADGVTPTYKLDVNGTANATTIYENGTSLANKYIANAGDNPAYGNGNEITQPSGEAKISIRTTTGISDVGILMLSQDCAYLCNSGDSGFVFAVWNTDHTLNFSENNLSMATFAVLENDCTIKGNTVVHSGNIGSYVTKASIVSTLGLGTLFDSTTWGTVNAANGFTVCLGTDQAGGGGLVIGEKDGRTSLQVDGDIFVDEGTKRVASNNQLYDFMYGGNEFNFASSGFSGDLWINYRTYGGYNGNITNYKLGNGQGGLLGDIIHTGNIGSQSVNYANSAGSVSWSNVTNKPTLYVYSFTIKCADSDGKDNVNISAIGVSTSYMTDTSTINAVLSNWNQVFGTSQSVHCSGQVRSAWYSQQLTVINARITGTSTSSGTVYYEHILPYSNASGTGSMTSTGSRSTSQIYAASMNLIKSFTV